MAGRDPEMNPAAFLGAELRRARLAAGFSSQDALAAKLGFDRTVVVKAETGGRPPSADVLAAWCQACQLDEELFGRFATLARSADGPVPTWFEDWLEAESEALMLRIWQPVIIPGLLQTAEYARALFLVGQTDTSEDAIEALVTARLDRQEILERADPPDVMVVLDEAVLHRLVGSPEAMHGQLIRVTDLSMRSYISVQVVPVSNGANAGLGGGFAIASTDDMPGTLRMEGVEDQTTDKRSLVRKAAVTFERLRGDALPRAASRDLILRLADELWKP
ncbi:MAG: helix-turn-helix domain-containing protein [Streptosporangiaceae bacterium]